MSAQYQERDIMALDEAGDYYIRHVSAMTKEQLHSKSDIAAELAWRDQQIDALAAQVEALHRAYEASKFTDFGDKILESAFAATPQHHLRELRAQAVEWAMNKLKAEYEAHPLLSYSAFAITQHIEAQSKKYADNILKGEIT